MQFILRCAKMKEGDCRPRCDPELASGSTRVCPAASMICSAKGKNALKKTTFKTWTPLSADISIYIEPGNLSQWILGNYCV